MPRYLDPEDFPFTQDEVRRAFALAGPAEEAAEIATAIAEVILEAERGVREAERARAAGSTDPLKINPPSWSIGIEAYALLWCLPDCSDRVDALMQAEWDRAEESHVQLIMALRRERIVGSAPAEVLAEARRRVAPKRAGWTRRKRAMADRLGVPRPDGSVKR